MTDDGEAANALMHPAHEVEKVYSVTVRGRVTPKQIAAMEALRSVGGREIRPARVKLLRCGQRVHAPALYHTRGAKPPGKADVRECGTDCNSARRFRRASSSSESCRSGRWRMLTGEVGCVGPRREFVKVY